MFDRIKKLFGNGAFLTALGSSGDSPSFAARFVSSEVMVLSLPVNESLDSATMSADEFLHLTEKVLKEMSEEKPVSPFTYASEMGHVLPIFTGQKAADHFVGRYSAEINRVVPFAC